MSQSGFTNFMRLSILTGLIATTLVVTALAFGQQAPPAYENGPNPGNAPADAAAPPDEPGRAVARLGVLSGEASVKRGDSNDWVAAALNIPLMAGDTLSVSPGGAVEFQATAASYARLAGDSEIRLADLENGHVQLQLAKGLVTYRVLRQSNEQAEISTPLAAVHPIGMAAVRVEVAPDGTTRVIVRHGDVEVATQKGSERVHEGNMMLIKGSTDDPEFQVVFAPAHDQWDTWSDQRDAYLQRSQSPRYVSSDITGAEDLDAYGRWNNDPQYGNVWTPTVPATWAPYREGRWVWEDYYGWTWVDASPWGWAPFHYGSWYYRTGFGWSWFPGHRGDRFWYRPALVGFFGFGGGGFGVGFGFGNVGWVPLAPYERFHPWYGRGWGGGRNVVVNNINIVHNTNITNVYRNARVANGVTGVSGADFQRGNFQNHFAVQNQRLQQASLVRGTVPMTPSANHLQFSNRQAAAGPRTDVSGTRFFGGSAGAQAARVPFAQQQNNVRQSVGRQFGSGSAPRAAATTPGWQRFGSPQAAPGGSGVSGQSYAPNGGARFGAGGEGGSRSVQVSPPIIHQRPSAGSSYGARPSYGGPPSGGQGYGQGYSRPSAPAYRAPAQSAPAYRAPAPQQSAPRSAPSAPRGGGSGGGHSNSGGHTSHR